MRSQSHRDALSASLKARYAQVPHHSKGKKFIDPNRPEKRCHKCKETKPRTAFSKSASSPDGLQYACKECTRQYDKERGHAAQRMKLYGISPEQYDEMVKQQNGCCAICQCPPQRKSLHVDHCHGTGQIRGLLCDPCNRALGLFRDNQEALARAIFYLQRTRNGPLRRDEAA